MSGGLVKNIDVLVLCGGKCGSSTLELTFTKNGYKCMRAHSANNFKRRFGYDGLYDIIDNSSENKKVYIIDSYRTPIERKISSFFENINTNVPNYSSMTIQQLINRFNNRYFNKLENFHSIDLAMDRYGVPQWSEFDFDKGYNIAQKGNLVFIKILFKDINNWEQILSSIFNKKIKIHNHNLSQNKPIYRLYNKFREAYEVPHKYITHILNNDEKFKIYNTEDDKEKYKQKWLNNNS